MSEQSTINPGFDVRNQDWFMALLEECRSAIVEKSFNSRMETIEGHWRVGESICNMSANVDKQSVINVLSRDLKKPVKDLQNNVDFYTLLTERYHTTNFEEAMSQLPEGKNISWRKIKRIYLGCGNESRSEKKSFRVEKIVFAFSEWYEENHNQEDQEVGEALQAFKGKLEEE